MIQPRTSLRKFLGGEGWGDPHKLPWSSGTTLLHSRAFRENFVEVVREQTRTCEEANLGKETAKERMSMKSPSTHGFSAVSTSRDRLRSFFRRAVGASSAASIRAETVVIEAARVATSSTGTPRVGRRQLGEPGPPGPRGVGEAGCTADQMPFTPSHFFCLALRG